MAGRASGAVKKVARHAPRLARIAPALQAAALRAQGDGVVISRLGAASLAPIIVFANDAFLAMTGHSLSALAGQPHQGLHSDRADLTPIRRWSRSTKMPRALSGEGYLVRADAATFYAAWSFSALPGRGGRVTHLVATYRDTTEKRRLEEALVHAQRLDAVGRLAGGVSHDFNNLLSVINGYCEMLAAELSDRPAALREVNEIHRAGLRAAALTRQLLAFGRRTPMDSHVVSLNRIVRENAEILQRLIGTAGQLELDLAPDLPNVCTDPTQFQQVLLNLVLNARDALRDRGCITIRTGEREIKPGLNRRATDAPPGRYVCLAVADNGTGMDAETQKHLFEPFFTTKPEGKGTGLGLALVYGVVQQSNGFVNVRTALLAGSTFEILLPRVTAAADVAPEPTVLAPLTANQGHEVLLVIETDEVVRKLVAGMLTASGYHVLAARSVEEGLEAVTASDRRPQLLVAPHGRQGEALMKTLQAGGADLLVLWVAQSDAAAIVPWLPPARQGLISKPFALNEILRVVRALLDARGAGTK